MELGLARKGFDDVWMNAIVVLVFIHGTVPPAAHQGCLQFIPTGAGGPSYRMYHNFAGPTPQSLATLGSPWSPGGRTASVGDLYGERSSSVGLTCSDTHIFPPKPSWCRQHRRNCSTSLSVQRNMESLLSRSHLITKYTTLPQNTLSSTVACRELDLGLPKTQHPSRAILIQRLHRTPGPRASILRTGGRTNFVAFQRIVP
jgi:hypothetical protein